MAASRTPRGKRWSRNVTEQSHALDLETGVFTKQDPRGVARLNVRPNGARTKRAIPIGPQCRCLRSISTGQASSFQRPTAAGWEAAKKELRKLYSKPRKAA